MTAQVAKYTDTFILISKRSKISITPESSRRETYSFNAELGERPILEQVDPIVVVGRASPSVIMPLSLRDIVSRSASVRGNEI